MSAPEHDITKLPRWAQQRIAMLERDVAWWQGKATAGEAEPTNTYIDRLIGGPEERRYLPDGEQVTFELPDTTAGPGTPPSGPWVHRITVRVHHDRGFLDVSDATGGALVVQPQSSNVVRIKGTEWW